MMKAPILGLGPSFCENLGLPMHKQNNPLKTVPKLDTNVKKRWKSVNPNNPPVPGPIQFMTQQNQANQIGNTGIAAFMCELCSTKLASIFGLFSWR